MNNKVDELVKWVAIRIKGNGRVLVNSFVNNNESVQIELCKLIARSILSHPDLALIDWDGYDAKQGVKDGLSLYTAIPLAEAFEEYLIRRNDGKDNHS